MTRGAPMRTLGVCFGLMKSDPFLARAVTSPLTLSTSPLWFLNGTSSCWYRAPLRDNLWTSSWWLSVSGPVSTGAHKMGRWTVFFTFLPPFQHWCKKPGHLRLVPSSLLSSYLDAVLQQLRGAFLLACAACDAVLTLICVYNQFKGETCDPPHLSLWISCTLLSTYSNT